jgi:hypothetical protein
VTTRAWIVSAFAMIALGCGGGKTNVKGSVTANGKAVVWGSVTLIDATGAYHQGDIDLQGNYEIQGVPTGTVKIGVSSPNPALTSGRGGAGGRGQPKGGAGASDDPREKFAKEQGITPAAPLPLPPPGAWSPLPNAEKNSDPNQSGITGEVKSGQPLNIDVK